MLANSCCWTRSPYCRLPEQTPAHTLTARDAGRFFVRCSMTLYWVNYRPITMKIHICQLADAHRDSVHKLYTNLDAESRYQRFGTTLNASALERYLAGLALSDGTVFGAFEGGLLVGVCEAVPVGGHAGIRELAFVVAPAYQGRQVGYLLGLAVLRHTPDKLVVTCATGNPAMARLARRLGFVSVSPAQPRGIPVCVIDDLATSHGVFAADRLPV